MKIIILIILSGTLFAQDTSTVEYRFNKSNYRRIINELASDEFLGRGVGQKGALLAADFLAKEFAILDLEAIGDYETYYQNVPLISNTALPSSKLNIHTKGDTNTLVLNKDYVVYKSRPEFLIPKPIEMVFVGYGISAPEFDYDDYNGIDVVGKVAVMISGEPNSDSPEYFNGSIPTIYSHLESKRRLALAHGAVASIIIPDPYQSQTTMWDSFSKEYFSDEVMLPYTTSTNLCIVAEPERAKLLFDNSKYSLEKVNEMFLNNDMKSFELSSKFTFTGMFKTNTFYSSNIIGLYKGEDTDYNDSYIVVSAHFDHLGVGVPIAGDSIYNGLLDNSMGVAALLEVARHIKQNDVKTKRSIIFLATTAEEKGLLGSTYYLDNSVRPLYKTIANVNIDGVAYIDEFESIIPIGARYSTLSKFVENIAAKNGLMIDEFPSEFIEMESFNRSDQVAFAQYGIPSILLLDGIQYKNIKSDTGVLFLLDYMDNFYHTPFDDLDIPINYNAVSQHINILHDLIIELANSDGTPEWHKESPYINRHLQNKAEKK